MRRCLRQSALQRSPPRGIDRFHDEGEVLARVPPPWPIACIGVARSREVTKPISVWGGVGEALSPPSTDLHRPCGPSSASRGSRARGAADPHGCEDNSGRQRRSRPGASASGDDCRTLPPSSLALHVATACLCMAGGAGAAASSHADSAGTARAALHGQVASCQVRSPRGSFAAAAPAGVAIAGPRPPPHAAAWTRAEVEDLECPSEPAALGSASSARANPPLQRPLGPSPRSAGRQVAGGGATPGGHTHTVNWSTASAPVVASGPRCIGAQRSTALSRIGGSAPDRRGDVAHGEGGSGCEENVFRSALHDGCTSSMSLQASAIGNRRARSTVGGVVARAARADDEGPFTSTAASRRPEASAPAEALLHSAPKTTTPTCPFPLARYHLRQSDGGNGSAHSAPASAATAHLHRPTCPPPPRPTAPSAGASVARSKLQQPVSVGEGTAVHETLLPAAVRPEGILRRTSAGTEKRAMSVGHVAPRGFVRASISSNLRLCYPTSSFPLAGCQLQGPDNVGVGVRGGTAAAAAARRHKPTCPIPIRPTAPWRGASAARCNPRQPASVGGGAATRGLRRLAASERDGGRPRATVLVNRVAYDG